MEFRELLPRRRMVRHYTSEPVPREVLERICATVRRAPSGGYSQGQRLLVVTDAGTRAELARALGQDGAAGQGLEPWLESAPAVILVLAREDDYHERYRKADKLQGGTEIEWPVPFWFVDAGAAMMLLLLAAIDEGLAAGVFGVPVEHDAAVRELLGIPTDLALVAGVTVGRPAPDPEWSARSSRSTQPRRPLEHVVRWERWTADGSR